MMFKIFKAGKFSEGDINDFYNENIVEKDKYLENGDIYVFYTSKENLKVSPMDLIERVYLARKKAELEVFDSTMGISESQSNLNDTLEAISKINPNEKENWDKLQKTRKHIENQIGMQKMTIIGRNKQIKDLDDIHGKILRGEKISIDEVEKSPEPKKSDDKKVGGKKK